MQIKQWIWLGTSLLFSYLFYLQSAGINFLILNILLVGTTIFLQPHLWLQRSYRIVALGCLLTATNVVWHHTGAAILLNFISLMCLSGLSLKPETSLVTAWINSGYSIVASLVRRMSLHTNFIEAGQARSSVHVSSARWMTWIVPAGIVTVFFMLYMSASPAFGALVNNFSLAFISHGFLLFTLLGAYLLFAFFYPVAQQHLVEADVNTPDFLVRQRIRRPVDMNPIGLKYEHRTGWILFIMLNVLIFMVNAVDFFYLITGRLPQGVTYSEYVHQGVNTLIASIVLAIGIVLYFFRGNLNFLRNNGQLKYATYLWIYQNVMLIFGVAYKNSLYIQEYGLTYKRIGVYVYLLLTLAGLVTTYIKVQGLKSNWYLFRKNAWAFYLLLVILAFFNWPRIITQYNLRHLPGNKLDLTYLINLPDTNLDLLYDAAHSSAYLMSDHQNERIHRKATSFIQKESLKDWQSWNFTDWKIYQHLQAME